VADLFGGTYLLFKVTLGVFGVVHAGSTAPRRAYIHIKAVFSFHGT
jgi:hypothetical protein